MGRRHVSRLVAAARVDAERVRGAAQAAADELLGRALQEVERLSGTERQLREGLAAVASWVTGSLERWPAMGPGHGPALPDAEPTGGEVPCATDEVPPAAEGRAAAFDG